MSALRETSQLSGRIQFLAGSEVSGKLPWTILLLWLSFSVAVAVNHGPIFFADTPTYFRVADAAAVSAGATPSIWSDRLPRAWKPVGTAVSIAQPIDHGPARPVPLSGRSIYFGAFLFLLNPVVAALAQGLLAASVVAMAARRLARKSSVLALMIVIGLSSATIFAALLMPDLFAALAVVSCALILAEWHEMTLSEQSFWLLVLLAGITAHSATLLIVAAMLVAALLMHCRRIIVWPVLLAIILGVAAEVAFSTAVALAIGSPPLRPPFLSARLVADGPGRLFLERDCAHRERFVQCRFYPNLSTNSDAILWSLDGTGFRSMPPDVQRAWAAEDARFALAVLLDDPVRVGKSTAAAIIKQASSIRIDDVVMPLDLASRIPDAERVKYRATLVARGTFPAGLWDRAAVVAALASLVALLLFRRRITFPMVLILCGIGLNIVICGALSTPHDRYLMRMEWLIPLLAVILATSHRIPTRLRRL